MLSPGFLEGLPDSAVELWRTVEDDILGDMARRLAAYDYDIPAAQYQRNRLEASGMLRQDIIKRLSALTGKSEAEVARLLEDAGRVTVQMDTERYTQAQIYRADQVDTASLNAILRAGVTQTNGLMRNITRTTANTAAGQFERLLDKAWLQVSSGAFDLDTAVSGACKELAQRGVEAIRYPNGHTDTLETAVRRAVRTGANQTAMQIQLELAEELGSDLVEVTAHAGARPEHAVWQGQVYSISGKTPGYAKLSTATGYGTGAGLGGWNCRHSFFPTWEGASPAYSQEELEEYTRPDAVEYNGKKMSLYEAEHMQRYNERQIRRWKREQTALEAAGLDASGAKANVHQWQARQGDFLSKTGLKRQYGREQMIALTAKVARSDETFTVIPPVKGDAIKPQSIYKNLQRSPVGKHAYKYIIENNIPVEINYTDEAPKNLRGRTFGSSIEVFARNTHTIVDTTSTIIHEATHIELHTDHNSQWEEAYCFVQEHLHRQGKLTYADLKDIIKTIKKLYPELPWR